MHCEKCGSADTEVTKCSKCGQKSLIQCHNCSYKVCADKYCEVISIKRKIKILTFIAVALMALMVVVLPVIFLGLDSDKPAVPTPKPTSTVAPDPTEAPPPPTSVAPDPPPAPDPEVVLREKRTTVEKTIRQLVGEGVGYKKGSSDPASGGLDFVGFVQYALGRAGEELPRNPGAILKMGDRISDRSQLEIGDIVVFSKKPNDSRPNFLGVYIGNDEFSCSYPSGARKGVIKVKLSHKFWSPRFLFGVRVLKP